MTRVPGTLTVRFRGRAVATLHPGCPPYTVGRGRDRSLRIGEVGPDGTNHVSRHAGSIQGANGLWMIRNDSDSRPFDVVVGGVAYPLAPCTSQDALSEWPIGPHPVKIQIADPWRLYIIELLPAWHPVPVDDTRPADDDETTEPLGRQHLDVRARRILAAKFLSRPEPGEALESNIEAAEYARAAQGPDEKPIDEDAVRNLVHRWKKELKGRGIQGLEFPNVFGRQLIAWGVINMSDRTLLRPWREKDGEAGSTVRPAGPADLEMVGSVLSRLSLVDPVLAQLIPDTDRRNRVLPVLVTLVAETILPLGTSLLDRAGGVALWTPPGRPATTTGRATAAPCDATSRAGRHSGVCGTGRPDQEPVTCAQLPSLRPRRPARAARPRNRLRTARRRPRPLRPRTHTGLRGHLTQPHLCTLRAARLRRRRPRRSHGWTDIAAPVARSCHRYAIGRVTRILVPELRGALVEPDLAVVGQCDRPPGAVDPAGQFVAESLLLVIRKRRAHS